MAFNRYSLKPAQLKALPYGGLYHGNHQYTWETYEGSIQDCSDLENADEDDWVVADKDLDDHQIQAQKL